MHAILWSHPTVDNPPLVWLIMVSPVKCFRGFQSTCHIEHGVMIRANHQFNIFREGRTFQLSMVSEFPLFCSVCLSPCCSSVPTEHLYRRRDSQSLQYQGPQLLWDPWGCQMHCTHPSIALKGRESLCFRVTLGMHTHTHTRTDTQGHHVSYVFLWPKFCQIHRQLGI